MITTEQLLVHPLAFGLTTASPVQRAICRAADGLPLGDLANDPTVVSVFGGPAALVLLPNEPPKEIYIVASIRSGKSLFSAALALKIALTIDLSFLAKSEIARVSVVSLDKDKAGAVMSHLRGALEREGGVLRRCLVTSPKPTAERVRVRRDDGRIVEIVIAAGKQAGGSLVSRWSCAAIFDEAARMQGQADGVVNFEDMRGSVIARLSLLKGAQLIVVTSPWAARGPIYEAVQKYTGKPSRLMVMVRATGPELNPVLWTPEAVEEVRRTDESAYITDVLGEFADVEGGLFLAQDLANATRPEPETLPRAPGWTYTAGMDPATRSNAWALVVVGFKPSDDGEVSGDRYVVVRTRQWLGSSREPLKAKEVLPEIAAELKEYGIDEVYTDQFGADLLKEIAEDCGLTVTLDTDTTAEKDNRWIDFRGRVLSGAIELSPDEVLRSDLLSARKRLTPNGIKVELPVTRDGRHADFAPAVVLAVSKAAQAPGWVAQMQQWRRNGGT